MRVWCWETATLRCPPQNLHNWLVILKGEHLSSEATPPSVHCFPWGDGREDAGTNEQLWRTLKEVISDLTPTKLKRRLDSARENRLCISEHKRRAVFSSFPRLPRSVFWFKGWDILAEIRGGAEGKQDPLRHSTFNTDRVIPVFELSIHKHRISKAADGNTLNTSVGERVYGERCPSDWAAVSASILPAEEIFDRHAEPLWEWPWPLTSEHRVPTGIKQTLHNCCFLSLFSFLEFKYEYNRVWCLLWWIKAGLAALHANLTKLVLKTSTNKWGISLSELWFASCTAVWSWQLCWVLGRFDVLKDCKYINIKHSGRCCTFASTVKDPQYYSSWIIR